MASFAAESCEKYLKHIINEYCFPETAEDNSLYKKVMSSHRIKKLAYFIENNMGIYIRPAEWKAITSVDGYYFGARYPSEYKCAPITKEELDLCKAAVDACRSSVSRTEKAFGEKGDLFVGIEHWQLFQISSWRNLLRKPRHRC